MVIFNLINNKSIFNKGVIDFFETTKENHTMVVKLLLPANSFDIDDTVFFPHSYTYEHGHFIGELSPRDGSIHGEFITFIDVEEFNEEAISKRLKNLKRTLEKISPSIIESKNEIKEIIIFKDYTASIGIDDELYYKNIKKNISNRLYFIGDNGPLKQNFLDKKNIVSQSKSISHFSRALLTYEQFKFDFSNNKDEENDQL